MLPGMYYQADAEFTDLRCENITVVDAPLLKIYYWECCNVEGLNNCLMTSRQLVKHTFDFPMQVLNDKPMKVYFWFRNKSEEALEINMRRSLNCVCADKQVVVGFAHFHKVRSTPERQLDNGGHTNVVIEAGGLVALAFSSCNFTKDEHLLTYNLSCSDNRLISLSFSIKIHFLDVNMFILTKSLQSLFLGNKNVILPVWVHNLTKIPIEITFGINREAYKILHPTMLIPPYCVQPLVLEHGAKLYENKIIFTMMFGVKTEILFINSNLFNKETDDYMRVPLDDYETSEYPHCIYPNRLEFDLVNTKKRTQIIAIHNFDKKRYELRWQPYKINEMFEIQFFPKNVTIEANKTKLFMAKLIIYNNKQHIHFKRIPAVLEVHHCIAPRCCIGALNVDGDKEQPKPSNVVAYLHEQTYIKSIFLHINVKVIFGQNPKKLPSWNPTDIQLLLNAMVNGQIFFANLRSYTAQMFNLDEIVTLPSTLNYDTFQKIVKNPHKDLCELRGVNTRFSFLLDELTEFLFDALSEILKDHAKPKEEDHAKPKEEDHAKPKEEDHAKPKEEDQQ